MRRRHAPGRRVAAGRAPAVGEPVFPSAAARRPSTTKLRQRRRSDARRRAPRGQIAARASAAAPAQGRSCCPATSLQHPRHALWPLPLPPRPAAALYVCTPSTSGLSAGSHALSPPTRLGASTLYRASGSLGPALFSPPTSSPTPPPPLRSVSAPLPRPGAIPRPQHSSSSRPAARTRRPSVPAHLHPPHPPSTSSWP